MNFKLVTLEDINEMDKRCRTNFINSLSGFKSLNLAGTFSNLTQNFNLAPVSSVIHVGAQPPLMGLLFRPDSVPRHTLENIRETGFWTLNHVCEEFVKKAHQTSARYNRDISEFEAAGLTAVYEDFPAPFVKESKIRIGLQLEESYDLKSNGTHFIVGKVLRICLPEHVLADDGFVNLEEAGTLTVSGLDSYHKTSLISRLPYAKP